MDFGIALATETDSWKVVARAEQLGFSHAWFYDTQLLNPDVFVAMALAAHRTRRIRLGTGVLIPTNRIAPVTANALASLNRLAPGRIDFGVGTGFTARRTMGQRAMPLADFRRYIDEVMGLLRGDVVDVKLDDGVHPVGFLNPDLGLINLADPIALHVSAFGPRSRRLAAELGAGWLNFSGDVAAATRALTDMQMAWANVPRPAAELYSTLFCLGRVLAPGERSNSRRALMEAGPGVAVFFHNLAESSRPGELSGVLDDDVNELLERYREVYSGYTPRKARYLANHRGHLMFVRPEERKFITGKLIKRLTFTAPEAELRERVERLREAGYRQLTVQLVHGAEDAIEDWARVFGLRPRRAARRRQR